jgi:hypothetical protein
MKKILFIVAGLLILSCTTGENMKSINQGDKKEYVLNLLGKPDGVKDEGDALVFTYYNRRISGWSNDKADYYIKLVNDVVVEYGALNVREYKPGTHILIINK